MRKMTSALRISEFKGIKIIPDEWTPHVIDMAHMDQVHGAFGLRAGGPCHMGFDVAPRGRTHQLRAELAMTWKTRGGEVALGGKATSDQSRRRLGDGLAGDWRHSGECG